MSILDLTIQTSPKKSPRRLARSGWFQAKLAARGYKPVPAVNKDGRRKAAKNAEAEARLERTFKSANANFIPDADDGKRGGDEPLSGQKRKEQRLRLKVAKMKGAV